MFCLPKTAWPPTWGLVGEVTAQAGAELAGRKPRTGEARSQEQARSRIGNTTGAVKGRGRRGR